MDIIPKLSLNRNPKDIPSNSIVAAKNIMIDDTGSYITNEYGFKIAFDCPNEHEFICGVIPTNKELVIFTFDTESKTSRIYRFSNGIANQCNIGWNYSGGKITGSYTYNYKGELIIAVGEYDAVDSNGNSIQIPFKCWNLDNCIDISHNQEEEVGKVKANYDIVSGNLVCGVYTIFIRFAVNDYDYTKWFQITPEIIIIDEVSKEAPTHTFIYNDGLAILQTDDKFKNLKVNSNKISDKGISLHIDINKNFSKYQIGYIIKHDEEVLGRIQNTYNANINDIVISDNIFAEEESIDKLLESPNQIYNVKNIITYNNRLYLSNYEEYKNENLTIDGIEITPKTKDINSSSTTITKTNIDCQIFFKSNYDNIASVFTINNVTKERNRYKVNNVSQFIIDNFVSNIKIYNTKGIGTNIVNPQYPELTEEGKKQFRYVREDFTLYLCVKEQKAVIPIYSTVDKKVSNINEITIYERSDNKIVLAINADYRTPTGTLKNQNFDLDDLFYEILLEGTYYLTWEAVAGLEDSTTQYNTAGYYHKFIGDNNNPLNGKYNGEYPTGGFAFEQSITINSLNYTYDKNKCDICRSLIPIQKYNIFIHYIRKDGSYTNGYFVKQIDVENTANINYLTLTNNLIPIGYIGYFYSYEDVEYNSIPVVSIESKNNAGIYDNKYTNTDFIYNENNIYGDNLKGHKFDGDIISKQYNKKSTSTSNVEVVNCKEASNIKNITFFTSTNNVYNKKVKTLYRLTDNKYETGDIDAIDYLPNFYNKEKIVVYTKADDNTTLADFIFNSTSSKVVTDKGVETHYDIWLYDIYNYSINPLNAYSIKQDYSKGAASLVTSTGTTLGVFYNSVLSPDKLHDFLEIKSAYTSKPSKSFTNYSKDYIDAFNKTIRRSNVVSDESPINGFKELDAEQYKIIKENKGDITNIVGIGLYLLVHTQYSLFVFDRTPKLTQTSQLQIPDVFDIDYQEVLPSNEGFGGLWNKEESIISKNGYIWYDRVNKYIFKYENGKTEILSSDINNFIKDVDIDTIRFGEDLETNRLLICIYIIVDNKIYNITLSYSFNTKTFISLHDYTFTNCYRTYNQSYFFDSNKDQNRLYVFDKNESGYRNLKNETSLYYPTYISKDKSNNSTNNESKENPDFDDSELYVNCIKKALIINEHSIQIMFDKELIKGYYDIVLYYKNGDNDYQKSYSIDLRTLDENGILNINYLSQITFYNINDNKLAKETYILYGGLGSGKNYKETNRISFNIDNGKSILNKIDVYDKASFVDNKYIINDYINFDNVNDLMLPLSISMLVGNKRMTNHDIRLENTYLPKAINYNLTISFLYTNISISKNINHVESKFENAIVTRNYDNINIKDNIDNDIERIYTINLYRNDIKVSKEDIVFTTNVKNDSINISNKIANKVVINCIMNNNNYEYSIDINDNIINPYIVHSNIGVVVLYKNDDNKNTKLYFAIDNGEYNDYEEYLKEQKIDNIQLNDKQTINCYNRYIEDNINYDSEIISFTYNKDVINKIETIEYTKVQAVNKVLKNYIDIIYCKDIESTKSLESIQYVLDNIKAPFGTINLAEQAFSRKGSGDRFSGDSIVLYSDETYSGEININDGGETNKMDNYKLPSFQKGHWEFNYFRNDDTTPLTKEELEKIYTEIPYDNQIVTITLNDLYKSFGITESEAGFILRSDNKSLIYGKYIVARFIFNNDKKIKLQNVTFITNNY